MSAESSRPPSPLSHPDSPNLLPMVPFSLDHLFSEDGSEYSNAFTLLGKPIHTSYRLLNSFMLDVELQTRWRHTGTHGWISCNATSRSARTSSRCARSSLSMRYSRGSHRVPMPSLRTLSARSPS